MTEPELTPDDLALEDAKREAAMPPLPVSGSADLPDDVPDGEADD